jgi:hypothetical protein
MQKLKVKRGVKKFIEAILENKADFLLSDSEGIKGGEIHQIRDLGMLLTRLIEN